MRPCPQCKGELDLEIRGHDNRSVETKVWVVCRQRHYAPDPNITQVVGGCGYENGPFKL